MVKFNEKGQLSDSYISRFCKGHYDQCSHFHDLKNQNVFDSLIPVTPKHHHKKPAHR